jgi:hypothetical protein
MLLPRTLLPHVSLGATRERTVGKNHSVGRMSNGHSNTSYKSNKTIARARHWQVITGKVIYIGYIIVTISELCLSHAHFRNVFVVGHGNISNVTKIGGKLFFVNSQAPIP